MLVELTKEGKHAFFMPALCHFKVTDIVLASPSPALFPGKKAGRSQLPHTAPPILHLCDAEMSPAWSNAA